MGFLWCFEVVRCQSKAKVCCISKFSLLDLESSRVTFERDGLHGYLDHSANKKAPVIEAVYINLLFVVFVQWLAS